MGRYLDSLIPFEAYKQIAGTRFFVDKTQMLEEILETVELDGQRYLCITRPRRFGKSVMADMVGAFLGKAADSSGVFDKLAVAESKIYKMHLGRHNVIFMDLSRVPRGCCSYARYIDWIQDGIARDLKEAYPGLEIDVAAPLWDALLTIFEKTKERFVFVIDEWDAVFHMPFISGEDQKEYLAFLKNLLKDQVYVELTYMTGVLPIAFNRTSCGTQRSDDLFVNASGESLQAVFPADALYSSGSELNMFMEYDMTVMERFSDRFGFMEKEVDRLYAIYLKTTKRPKIAREELRMWYDEIFFYVKNDIEDIRDDLVLMVAGEGVETELRNYAAVSMKLDTKDEIYSAMVIYGLLTYMDGKVFIPNKELMDKFQELLMDKESMGYVYRLANESRRMLSATLQGDTKTMAEILEFAHNTESPIFSYNSEIELSAVVNLVYLAARDRYRVEREDKAGAGYVDFIFYPQYKDMDGMILELKVDSTPEDAIGQIKEKGYALRFKGKMGEKQRYGGRILAVGISYDRKTKKHFCKVEVV